MHNKNINLLVCQHDFRPDRLQKPDGALLTNQGLLPHHFQSIFLLIQFTYK